MKNPMVLTAVMMTGVALLVGCASGRPETAIRKVQMYHLKSEELPDTRDPMIRAETRQRLWGAVTRAERTDRIGNYYRILWKTSDTATPATVRFEYRQANTGSKLQTLETQVPSPGKSNATEFRITGQAYTTGGRVVAWRAQVLQGGEVIGGETSFLWD